jgi:hypothetical protein
MLLICIACFFSGRSFKPDFDINHVATLDSNTVAVFFQSTAFLLSKLGVDLITAKLHYLSFCHAAVTIDLVVLTLPLYFVYPLLAFLTDGCLEMLDMTQPYEISLLSVNPFFSNI